MELINDEIRNKLKLYPIRSQDGLGENAKVIVKYFNPIGAGTWLITEAQDTSDGDIILYGYCHIYEWEWGSVYLSELQDLKLPLGMRIERDLYCDGKTVKELAAF